MRRAALDTSGTGDDPCRRRLAAVQPALQGMRSVSQGARGAANMTASRHCAVREEPTSWREPCPRPCTCAPGRQRCRRSWQSARRRPPGSCSTCTQGGCAAAASHDSVQRADRSWKRPLSIATSFCPIATSGRSPAPAQYGPPQRPLSSTPLPRRPHIVPALFTMDCI